MIHCARLSDKVSKNKKNPGKSRDQSAFRVDEGNGTVNRWFNRGPGERQSSKGDFENEPAYIK